MKYVSINLDLAHSNYSLHTNGQTPTDVTTLNI